jgi:pimeloyl-ACP methyl ester carboxylesterase
LTEILARDNFAKSYNSQPSISIDNIVLCNGSIHIEMAQLLLMQKLLRHAKIGPVLARLSSQSTLKHNLKKIYFNPEYLTDKELEAIWYLMNFNQGKRVLAKISQYTFERSKLWYRWINALQQTKLSIKIIWPDNDPIAIPQMAETIHQETLKSELVWLTDLGHFPMLENPEYWAKTIIKI